MKKIYNYLISSIKKEKNLLRFNLIIFIIGVIFGTIFINFINEEDKILLQEQIALFINNISKLTKDVFGISVFLSDFASNILELSIIFILGISMIGILFIIVYMFFKGFVLGMSLSTFIINYGFRGIVGMVLYFFPFYIFNIIIYFFMSFFSIYASIKFIKSLVKKDKLDFKTFFGKYLLSYITCVILLILYCLGNAYIMPYLLKIFTLII